MVLVTVFTGVLCAVSEPSEPGVDAAIDEAYTGDVAGVRATVGQPQLRAQRVDRGRATAVIVTVIMALLAWMTGTFFFGGTTTFKKIWGVTMLGGLIGCVGKILMLPLVIAKNSIAVSLGPAALYPSKDITSILFMILMYLDLFHHMVGDRFTGIGYAAVFDFPRGKGIAISVIVTLIVMAVGSGLGVFGMSVAGLDVHFL